MGETLDRLLEVKANVEDRREADDSAETMAIKVEIIHFRSPDRDKDTGHIPPPPHTVHS